MRGLVDRLRARRTSGVAGVAVSFAVALLSASLCGGVLYVSSAGTAAVHEQLAQACPDTIGLGFRLLTFTGLERVSAAELIAAVPSMDHVLPPIITTTVQTQYRLVHDDGGHRSITLIARTGAGEQVQPAVASLDDHSLAMSRTVYGIVSANAGDTIVIGGFPDGDRTMHVTSVFDDLGVKVPDYWCSLVNLVGTNPNGDEPPTVALADPATLRVDSAEGRTSRFVVYDIDPRGMSLHDMRALLRRFQQVAADFSERFQAAAPRVGDLQTLIHRAEGVRSAVRRSTLPAVGAGVASALAVLVGSGALFARERRRSLRLRVMRGAGVASNTWYLARTCLLPALLGAAGGCGAAWLAVTRWGPSSITEAASVRTAWVYAALALLGGLVVVAVAGALTAAQFVDPTVAHPLVRRILMATVVAALVGLVAWSHMRLRDGEGLRVVGVQPIGGSFIAQGFPLLAVCGLAVALAVPLRMMVARVRVIGGRLPRALRLGWRRAVHEPLLTTVLVVVTAVAVGCVMLSIVLTRAGTDALDAKARQYVGADVALNVLDDVHPPAGYEDRSTMMYRGRGEVDGIQVMMIGVDEATASEALFFPDGETRSRALAALATVTARLAGADELPAVVVGDRVAWKEGDAVNVTIDSKVHTLRVTAVLRAFPGVPRTDTSFMIDPTMFPDLVRGYTHTLIVRAAHPDPEVGAVFADAGARVKSVMFADKVFDVSSYSAQRWSYGMLAALGWFFAAVAVLLQIVAAWARRRARQQAVLMLRGNRPGVASSLLSAVIEVAVPLVAGALAGALLAVVAASIGVDLLDPLRNLAPAAHIRLSGGPLGMLGALVAGAVMVCGVFSALVSRPHDPMALMRETV